MFWKAEFSHLPTSFLIDFSEKKKLGRKLGTSTRPASLQYQSATFGCHASSETMSTSALQYAGLKCSFHNRKSENSSLNRTIGGSKKRGRILEVLPLSCNDHNSLMGLLINYLALMATLYLIPILITSYPQLIYQQAVGYSTFIALIWAREFPAQRL